jgi:flap endonuclease-1
MGIKHLYQLIEEHAPEAVKKGEIKNQFGRKVAIVRSQHSQSNRSLANVCRMRMHISNLQ